VWLASHRLCYLARHVTTPNQPTLTTTLALLTVLLACNDPAPIVPAPPPSPPPVTTTAPAPAAPDAANEVLFVRRSRDLMGTVVMITVADRDDSVAVPAIEEALDEVARLERLLSEWDEASEISAINRNAGKAPVKVSAETMLVVKSGIEISRWSDGAFDLSWAALRGMYKFQPNDHTVPERSELTKRLALIRYQDIVVDDAATTVFLKRAGMTLGTGGIAKGYALDRAGEILVRRGITSFMIFGGGQVLVHGKKGNRPWRVGVQHPRKDDYFGFVEAVDASVATAGDYEHSFIDDSGRRWHHIIDVRTGLPVAHTSSVTVVAPTGLYADAIDTAIFILGAEEALKRLDRAPGPPIDVLIVDADMRLHMNQRMHDKLILKAALVDGNRLP